MKHEQYPNFLKIVSIVLSIAILVASLPLSALATEVVASIEETQQEQFQDVGIVEMTDMRTESAKYFRLEDGSYVLAQYNSPVHYADANGNWQDIDNRLFGFGSNITSGDARIKFASKTTGNGVLFTLHEGNRKLTMSLNGAEKKIVGAVHNYTSDIPESETELGKITTLTNLRSSILYADILSGVDLEYIINGAHVKENIIVKERQDTYAYSFTVSLNNLTATALADGSVSIVDPASGEAMYQIPAPVMWDAEGVTSTAATITLVDNGNGKYTLTVTADSAWMNTVDRAFPVTIDPPIYSAREENVVDLTVSSTMTHSVNDAKLYASTTKKSYWKLTQLPVLPNSAYITKATFMLHGANEGELLSAYIGVYDVVSAWDDTLTWTASNETNGLAAANYTDFAEVEKQELLDDGGILPIRYNWNITTLVKKWYSGENNGLMLCPLPGTEVTGEAKFHSANAGSESRRPVLEIQYRDMQGIENYWSFTSQSAGFAGTSAVNNATGNLILTIPTLTSTDALMPFTPTLVYNSAIEGLAYTSSNTNSIYESPITANGFKLNVQECVAKQSYINSQGFSVTRYVWADADGTEHYFYKHYLGTYRDEDGLQLYLNESGTTLTITDANKNVREFTSVGTDGCSWALNSITDKNGNRLSFLIDFSGRPTAVVMTPNGSAPIEQLRLSYNTSGRLAVVWNPTSGEGVVLKYSADGTLLTRVIRAHGTSVESEWLALHNGESIATITVDATADYAYVTGTGLLSQLTNNLSRYRLKFFYDAADRVTCVREWALDTVGSEKGQEVHFIYGTATTTVRTSGADDAYNQLDGNGNDDDLLTKYVFDSCGRTISTYTTDVTRTILYGASSGQYVGDENENAKNNIKSSVQTVQYSSNYLLNGGFESADLDSVWTKTGNAPFLANDYTGRSAQGISVNDAVSFSSISQAVSLKDGEYYLSFAINSDTVPTATVKACVKAADNTVIAEQTVPVNEKYATGAYAFFGMPVSIHSGTTVANAYTVEISISGALGETAETVTIDNVMLSRTTAANEYDMISSGHFETTNSAFAPSAHWSYTKSTETEVVPSVAVASSGSKTFENALRIGSNMGQRGVVEQIVYQADEGMKYEYSIGENPDNWEPKFFTLSGWGKGTAQSHFLLNQFEIRAEITYYNGTESVLDDTEVKIEFDRDTSEWQFGSVSFATDPDKGMVDTIKIKIAYTYHPGTGYFDNISLIEDNPNASVYSYNDNGYVTSYTSGKNSTSYEYNTNNDISRSVSSDKTIVDYAYDGNYRVITEEYKRYVGKYSSDGNPHLLYRAQYTYNNYGQLTQTTVRGYDAETDTFTLQTQSSASFYVEAGSHIFGTLASESDAMGRTTRYLYNETNGWLLATVAPDNTGVCYTYDAIGNLVSVLPATYSEGVYTPTENNASVDYTYDAANRLDTITTDSTVYSFAYDKFGNSANISIGENELVEYEYNANNGKLNTLYYGGKDDEGNARGLAVRYVYDALDRTSEIWYNTGENNAYEKVYSYEYNTFGSLHSVTDYKNNEITVYRYDVAGNLLDAYVCDMETYRNKYATGLFYDDQYRINSQFFTFDYAASDGANAYMLHYFYAYDDETGNIWYVEIDDDYMNGEIEFAYDNLNALTQKVIDLDPDGEGSFYQKFDYAYEKSGNLQGDRISGLTVTVGSTEAYANVAGDYEFSYDTNGNITCIKESDRTIFQYTYDELGQLIREDNKLRNRTYVYEYDTAGNITAKEEYRYTTDTLGTLLNRYTYTYGNAEWGDQLTKIGDDWIVYDQIGNPTLVGEYIGTEAYYANGYELTWNGRELTQYRTFTNDGEGTVSYGDTITYTYNADGIRTSKTVNGIKHEYYLSGSQIMAETWIENGVEHTLIYLYDESGSPIGLKYRNDGYTYDQFDCFFFEKNLQGDIIAVYNEFGEKIGTYFYDAWGKQTATAISTDALEATVVTTYNPFRYRGYYYDVETGWYYLQSRYYNPTWGRFLNADTYVSTGKGLIGNNMYAYCNNNTIKYVDGSGKSLVVALLVTIPVNLCVACLFTPSYSTSDDYQKSGELFNSDRFNFVKDDIVDRGLWYDYKMRKNINNEYTTIEAECGLLQREIEKRFCDFKFGVCSVSASASVDANRGIGIDARASSVYAEAEAKIPIGKHKLKIGVRGDAGGAGFVFKLGRRTEIGGILGIGGSIIIEWD